MQAKRRIRGQLWNVSLALELATKCRERLHLGIPADIMRVAQDLGVRSIEPADIGIDGYLGRDSDGSLLIKFNRRNSRHRNRFTVAHELGHLFLYQASGVPIPTVTTRAASRNNYEESAANQIAAELLMPERDVRPRIEGRQSWHSLSQLAKEFDVSLRAMATRAIEVCRQPAALIRASKESCESKVYRVTCSTSKQYEIHFYEQPTKLATRILNGIDATDSRFVVDADRQEIELACDVMSFGGDVHQESWLLCWPT